jgi:hypothetical protein
MTVAVHKRLTTDEILRISSEYLREGRRQDVWEIVSVEVSENRLDARVRMVDYYKSPTDTHGFHLTSFATMEFISQLFIIYGHVLAGLTEKSQEAWMMESSISCRRAIRSADDIRVEMHFKTLKKMGTRMLGTARARIWDEQGGEFTAEVKALLA